MKLLAAIHSVCILALSLIPWQLGVSASTQPVQDPHVCIIGGGIAAASTTYFLSQLPNPPRTTVFEKSHRVGGRVRTLALPGTAPVEAGASIIASANRLMRHFATTLNLPQVAEPDGALGLWNGTDFVFRSRPSGPMTVLALVLRYRLSLLRMTRLVNNLLRQYDTLYPQPRIHIAHVRPAASVQQLFARAPDLFAWSQRSLADVVAPLFSQRFTDELVSAIVRVNYGQEVDAINGLAGAVGLAGSGADLWAVGGGNERVVRGLLDRSGATVRLNTTVRALRRDDGADGKSGPYTLSLTRSQNAPDNPAETPATTADDETLADERCDAVVLAAPYELSGLTVPADVHGRLDAGRQFHLCVATFVRGVVRNMTFGDAVPEDVLTTRHGDATGFISLTPASHTDGGVTGLWKVFTSAPIRDETVRLLFRDGARVVGSFPWRAYPTYSVPQRFVPFDVDAGRGAFVYTSAIESAGSAMEMSAVAGMNAAGLVVERLGLERGSAGEKDEL